MVNDEYLLTSITGIGFIVNYKRYIKYYKKILQNDMKKYVVEIFDDADTDNDKHDSYCNEKGKEIGSYPCNSLYTRKVLVAIKKTLTTNNITLTGPYNIEDDDHMTSIELCDMDDEKYNEDVKNMSKYFGISIDEICQWNILTSFDNSDEYKTDDDLNVSDEDDYVKEIKKHKKKKKKDNTTITVKKLNDLK